MKAETVDGSVSVVIPVYNEEKLIKSCLESLYRQSGIINFSTVLVDNGSTDATQQKIDEFSTEYSDFPLTVLEEAEKGTGIAAHTGFDYAINRLGSETIARIDADSIASPNWLISGLKLMAKPDIKLGTGPVNPRNDDEFYRSHDDYSWPVLCLIGRLSHALVHRDSMALGHAAGCNTFVKAAAYEHVGGYPQTAIEEKCEDVELSKRIKEEYGLRSMGWDKDIMIYQSMRRRRALGVTGLAKCYILEPDNKAVRLAANKGNVDIR
jgi:glycosyltransferase involved in cell wall biosynthesis